MPAWDEAKAAWTSIAENGPTPESLAAYKKATLRAVRELNQHAQPKAWPKSAMLADGHIISIDQGATHLTWQPRLLDHLEAPSKIHPSPIKDARRPGVGATLTGVREHDAADLDASFVYSRGQHLPVTAVLDFGSGSKTEATLRLYDPRETTSINIGKQKVTLAADFASPVQDVLDRQSFVKLALGGLLRPGRFGLDQSLFSQEPYRPDKLPIVLVHGLASDPHIWENIVVAMMADPEIAPHVQCWCYLYPTGLPLVASSADLRKRLDLVQRTFSAQTNTAPPNDIMIVGHSMGGLLTRMQVIDSGETFWRTWFTRPPEQVPLDSESSHQLRASLLFKANPKVKEVVFIATPHRGAELADTWLAKIASRLIHAPRSIIHIITSVATLDVEMINPERLSLDKFGATSVSSLGTKHPSIQALNCCPIKANCHSIIGVKNERVPLEESTDGFVPYHSSHIEKAASEKLVNCGHSCTEHLDTVDEALRIVREHLKRTKRHLN